MLQVDITVDYKVMIRKYFTLPIFIVPMLMLSFYPFSGFLPCFHPECVGVVKLATLLSSAARRAKSTATTVANPGTWQRNAPSRPPLSPDFLVAPSFSD